MTNKISSAKGLYLEGIRDGNMQEALDKYIGKHYIQHSTGVRDGKEGFIEFFSDFLKRCPERDIRIIRAIEDGSNVFVHAYQNINHKQSQWITTDMFDTDVKDKILEHWDVIAAYTEKDQTVSKNDPIFGDFILKDLNKTAENKKTIRNFITQVFQNDNLDLMSDYVDNQLVQHDALIDNGLDAYKIYAKKHSLSYDFIFKILGQGDHVVAYSKVWIDQKAYAQFDIYRLVENKIVEHWVNTERIEPFENKLNSGKF